MDDAFTLENLRAYYTDRSRSPWPQGITPPVEAYGVLQALWQEADREIGAADRAKYVVLNALSDQRVRDLDTHPEMVAVENRRGIARLRLATLQAEMTTLRRRAHDQGLEFPDPRLH